MRKAGRVENFQPHMHLRGKAMMVEAILPNGTQQVLGYVPNFEFNWMNNYVFADDYAPLLPKGTILKVTAWHDNTRREEEQPRPDAVDRLGRPHRGRNGARVDQHHLHERRRLHQGSRRAQGEDGDHDRSPAAVRTRHSRTPGCVFGRTS